MNKKYQLCMYVLFIMHCAPIFSDDMCNNIDTVGTCIEFDYIIDDENSMSEYKQEYEPIIRSLCLDMAQLSDDLIQAGYVQSAIGFAYDGQPVDLVFVHKGQVVGFISFFMCDETKDVHIYMFVIDKNYRGQGLGEKFLLKIIQNSILCGMKTISLKAHKITNSAAIKLYKKVGFVEDESSVEDESNPDNALTSLIKVL